MNWFVAHGMRLVILSRLGLCVLGVDQSRIVEPFAVVLVTLMPIAKTDYAPMTKLCCVCF